MIFNHFWYPAPGSWFPGACIFHPNTWYLMLTCLGCASQAADTNRTVFAARARSQPHTDPGRFPRTFTPFLVVFQLQVSMVRSLTCEYIRLHLRLIILIHTPLQIPRDWRTDIVVSTLDIRLGSYPFPSSACIRREG
jgi:hypothetical protein